jgi:hypothetical protein
VVVELITGRALATRGKCKMCLECQRHINDDVQVIIASMVHGWMRDMSIKNLVKLVVRSNWDELIHDVLIFVK